MQHVSENRYLRVIPQDQQHNVRQSSRHGTCMATLIGGTRSGVFPAQRNIIVSMVYGSDSGIARAFGQILSDVRASTTAQRIIINLSASILPPRRRNIEDVILLDRLYDVLTALTATGRVLIMVAAGNQGQVGQFASTLECNAYPC